MRQLTGYCKPLDQLGGQLWRAILPAGMLRKFVSADNIQGSNQSQSQNKRGKIAPVQVVRSAVRPVNGTEFWQGF